MSILLDPSMPVVVQGITGAQGRVDAVICRRYGTRILAGVTPGRGGESVEGIPVYDSVAEAVARQGVRAS
ncbi:MAG: succinate--CoA ligase subunit alpha, partial [Acetobacterales bacterium]